MNETKHRHVIEAPNYGGPSIFLAGGITGCPDWQTTVIAMFSNDPFTLYNPRRADFPIHAQGAARQQIEWEWRYLDRADAILFWFCKETLCPIVLFELGRWSGRSKPIFVGVEDGYQRWQDVEIQLRLERPTVTVVQSLNALCAQVRDYQDVKEQHYGQAE